MIPLSTSSPYSSSSSSSSKVINIIRTHYWKYNSQNIFQIIQSKSSSTSSFSSSSSQKQKQQKQQQQQKEPFHRVPHKLKVLVVGSSGDLGRSLIRHLSIDWKAKVIGADIIPPKKPKHEEYLNEFILLPHPNNDENENNDNKYSLENLLMTLDVAVTKICSRWSKEDRVKDPDDFSIEDDDDDEDDEEFEESRMGLDAVVCVAGNWQGDHPIVMEHEDEDENENEEEKTLSSVAKAAMAQGKIYEQMIRANFHPTIASGYIAIRHCQPTNNNNTAAAPYEGRRDAETGIRIGPHGGLFVAMGASACLSPINGAGMMAYVSSKAAVHHYIQTLGLSSFMPWNGQFQKRIAGHKHNMHELRTVAILPTVLDTPTNRKTMRPTEKELKLSWAKLDDVSHGIAEWIGRPYLRPHSGALVKVTPMAMTKMQDNDNDDDEDQKKKDWTMGVSGRIFQLVR